MSLKKLHTRQYAAGRHTIRTVAAMAAVGLGTWCSSGIAHTDNNHEQQACALMDDHATAISLGYTSTPVQYAFAVLSTEMPPEDAAHVVAAATRDDCPNHAADLPDNWF